MGKSAAPTCRPACAVYVAPGAAVKLAFRSGQQGRGAHCADKFEVLTLAGKPLARRVLYHPHVKEQPFTRSVGGVRVTEGMTQIVVCGHDKVHDYGAVTVTVRLPDR